MGESWHLDTTYLPKQTSSPELSLPPSLCSCSCTNNTQQQHHLLLIEYFVGFFHYSKNTGHGSKDKRICRIQYKFTLRCCHHLFSRAQGFPHSLANNLLIITYKPLMIILYRFCFWTPFQSYQKDLPSKLLVLDVQLIDSDEGVPTFAPLCGSLLQKPGKVTDSLCYPSEGLGQRLTFTARDSRAPDHIPILQDTGDGLRTLGLHKAVVTVEGHRTSQQKPVSKSPAIHRNARVVALILTKRWTMREKSQQHKDTQN